MSDTPFYLTGIGRRFYESTMPELVAQLKRLNDNIERIYPPTAKVTPDPDAIGPPNVPEPRF